MLPDISEAVRRSTERRKARKSAKEKADAISLKPCRGCFMPYTHKRGNVRFCRVCGYISGVTRPISHVK